MRHLEQVEHARTAIAGAIQRTGKAKSLMKRKSVELQNAASPDERIYTTIRLSADLADWLNKMVSLRVIEFGKERPIMQDAAISLLLSVKAAYQSAELKKQETVFDVTEQIDDAPAKLKKSYTIGIAPDLADWLAEMAAVEMRLTGRKNITMQQAAVTILTMLYDACGPVAD